MKIHTIIILLISSILFSNCATLFSRGYDEVFLSSEPSNAKVTLNGAPVGKTPIKLSLNKRMNYIIEFMREGFEKQSLNITHSVGASWVILDILSGLIGILIDAVSGYWYEFDIKDYKAKLTPIENKNE